MGKATSFIYSMNSENIRIYGEGIIDLNGDAFFRERDWYVPSSKIELAQDQIEECTLNVYSRINHPIFFYRCRNVKLEGIKIVNSPCWTVAFCECQDVKVMYITIDNSLNVPNDDGIHLTCSKGVIIHGCSISCGDDCIAATCITDWNMPCEDIVVSDCILKSCSKAIVCGYMHSIVRNITITNCVVKESNRAFCIMTSSGTSIVENIRVSNMILDTKIRCGNWWGNGEPIAVFSTYHNSEYYRDGIPDRNIRYNIRDVHFDNITCTGENAIGIVGEGKNMENVTFSNISFRLKDSRNLGIKGRVIDTSPSLEHPEFPEDAAPYWLLMKDVDNVKFHNVCLAEHNGVLPKAHIVNCQNYTID